MSVVVLDAVAMTIYYGAGLAHGSTRTRNVYLIAMVGGDRDPRGCDAEEGEEGEVGREANR